MKKHLKAQSPSALREWCGQRSFKSAPSHTKLLREHKALSQGCPSSPGVVIHHLGVWLDKGVIHHFQLRVDHSYSGQLQSLLSVALQGQGRCDERHRPATVWDLCSHSAKCCSSQSAARPGSSTAQRGPVRACQGCTALKPNTPINKSSFTPPAPIFRKERMRSGNSFPSATCVTPQPVPKKLCFGFGPTISQSKA